MAQTGRSVSTKIFNSGKLPTSCSRDHRDYKKLESSIRIIVPDTKSNKMPKKHQGLFIIKKHLCSVLTCNIYGKYV